MTDFDDMVKSYARTERVQTPEGFEARIDSRAEAIKRSKAKPGFKLKMLKPSFAAAVIAICVLMLSGAVFAANVLSSKDGFGYFSRLINKQEYPVKTAETVAFSDMAAWWDTGWGDDEFVLTFWVEGYSDISEYGIKCWDSNGKEITYIDGPSAYLDKSGEVHTFAKAQANAYFCIEAIDSDGSYTGSLAVGETYSWTAYAIRDGKRYESPVNTFVLSTEDTRFGK